MSAAISSTVKVKVNVDLFGSYAPARVSTWCDCGEVVSGFEGVLSCGSCGALYSVSRMKITVTNEQGPKAAEG